MQAIRLTKTATYLYRTDYDNPIRQEIYKLTENKHPKDDIEVSDDILKEVERAEGIINKKNRRR